MVKSLRIVLLLFTSLYVASSFSQSIAPNVKRILFLGNSITWQGNYINYVESYIITHNPGRKFEFMNLGLPSETVSGLSEEGHAGGSFPRPDLHERLARVLQQCVPDLVFACYGMNDGIYMPFDAGRFHKFKDGIRWMHDEILKTGARLIHLTPPDYDVARGKSKGYDAVLDTYADWLLNLRSSAKWEVIDIHYPMKRYLEAHRKVDSKFSMDGFALAEDGVHPGEAGHWIIAKQILLYLGYKEVAKAPRAEESLPQISDASQVIKLVAERQNVMRDSWLTATKHLRPGLPVGLPLTEAKAIADEIDQQAYALIENKNVAEVYLIGGQSNATGQGYVENMADTMKVKKQVMIFHSGKPHLDSGLPEYTWQPMHQASESPDRFGPELGFSSRIASLLPGARVAIIKHAHSGTNLYAEWNPGKSETDTAHWGVQFKEFVHTVNAGLDSLRKRGYEPIIKGMIWQQGEAEAYSPDSISIQYGVLLKHFYCPRESANACTIHAFCIWLRLPSATHRPRNKNSSGSRA